MLNKPWKREDRLSHESGKVKKEALVCVIWLFWWIYEDVLHLTVCVHSYINSHLWTGTDIYVPLGMQDFCLLKTRGLISQNKITSAFEALFQVYAWFSNKVGSLLKLTSGNSLYIPWGA